MFKTLGITKNQEKVLKAIQGLVTTTQITKKTGISRPNTYDLLNKLIEKGLVTRLEQNKQVLYKANKIDVTRILSEKQKEMKNFSEEVKKYNKALELLQDKNYDVQVYTGKAVLNYIFQLSKEDIKVFGAEGKFENQYPAIFKQWMREIKENKTKIIIIYNEKYRVRRNKKQYEEIKPRYTKRELPSKVTTLINKKEVNIIHWEKTLLLISIKNKEIAESYNQEFKKLWRLAHK